MTIRTTLYGTDNYRATLHYVSAAASTVIVFDHWEDRPSLDAESPGARFFVNTGHNVVGIKTARNDWYQGAEMGDVCSAVLAGTPSHFRIGYGGSMGGYAAINFAADLQLDLVIAICPQFSIDPAKAPFERRWLTEACTITFHQDKIDQARHARGYLVFDPCTVDRLHAELILAHHDLLPIRIHHGGHDQMLMLQQCGMLATILIEMVHNRFDLSACLELVRRRRRGSVVFWLNLAVALARHGRHEMSHQALLAARALPDSDLPSFQWRFHAALTACLAASVHCPPRKIS